MRRILIAATGSHGDIHPFLALGRELQARGHEVRFVASAKFEPEVAAAGLTMVPVGTAELYDEIVRHPDTFHPRRGFKVIVGATLDWLPEAYRRLEEHVEPGRTWVVGSTLSFATRLLQEARRLPVATVHLAPSIFRSACEPPVMAERPLPRLPAAVVRAIWYLIDAAFVDPFVCPRLNRFRATLGLGPVRRVFQNWIHGGDVNVGLFPPWFATPQPDWPGATHLTGFAFYDGATPDGLPARVESFLEDGPPPVVFTSGTAAARAHHFFEASVAACRTSGRRGLLLARYRDQVPDQLPEGVMHAEYAPFSQLFPRASAIVHHGGIGTLAQALRAGRPQLVRPMAFDQFDNAARLAALGVARVLPGDRYSAGAVARALDDLTGAPTVARACASAAARLCGGDAAAETADVIEQALAARSGSP